jgi:hypothetical protein
VQPLVGLVARRVLLVERLHLALGNVAAVAQLGPHRRQQRRAQHALQAARNVSPALEPFGARALTQHLLTDDDIHERPPDLGGSAAEHAQLVRRHVGHAPLNRGTADLALTDAGNHRVAAGGELGLGQRRGAGSQAEHAERYEGGADASGVLGGGHRALVYRASEERSSLARSGSRCRWRPPAPRALAARRRFSLPFSPCPGATCSSSTTKSPFSRP